MVNNNNLIIENKKVPIEEVREINYQVPSFEEFMKSYEGGVNYADLSSGDIGEVKRYGPVIMKDGGDVKLPPPEKYDRCKYCRRNKSRDTDDYCLRDECFDKHREEREKWNKRCENAECWVNRVATGVFVAATGPAAPFVGGAIWGASEIAKANCENEDAKKVIGSFGEGGGSVALEKIGGKLKKFLD